MVETSFTTAERVHKFQNLNFVMQIQIILQCFFIPLYHLALKTKNMSVKLLNCTKINSIFQATLLNFYFARKARQFMLQESVHLSPQQHVTKDTCSSCYPTKLQLNYNMWIRAQRRPNVTEEFQRDIHYILLLQC